MWPTFFIPAVSSLAVSGGIAAAVTRTANYDVTAGGAFEAVPFDGVTAQEGTMWEIDAPTVLKAAYSGLYLVSGTVTWAADTSFTGARHAAIRVNGDEVTARCSQLAQSTTLAIAFCVVGIVYANAGDTIELAVATDKTSGVSTLTYAALGAAKIAVPTTDFVSLQRNSTLTINGVTAVGMSDVLAGASALWAGSGSANILVPADKLGWWLFGGSAEVDTNGSANTSHRVRTRRGGTTIVGSHKSAYLASTSSPQGLSQASVVKETNVSGIDYQLLIEEVAATNPTLRSGEGRFFGAWLDSINSVALVGRSSNLTLPQNTDNVFTWNSLTAQEDTLITVPDTKLTVPSGKAGWYFISGNTAQNAGNIPWTSQWLRKNGTTTLATHRQYAQGNSVGNQSFTSAIEYLNDGDYIEVLVRFTGTASLTYSPTEVTRFSATRLPVS